MYKLIYVIILFFTAVFLNGQDFKSFNWGDSIEKIKNNENSYFINELNLPTDNNRGRVLMYKVNINNDMLHLAYYFHDNKLYLAKYIVASDQNFKDFNEPKDWVEYKIQKYKEFEQLVLKYKQLLINKYGNFKDDDNTTKSIDDSSVDQQNEIFQKIMDNGIDSYTVWDLQRTRIFINLKMFSLHDSFKDKTNIDTFSINYRDLNSDYYNSFLKSNDNAL